MLSSLGHVNMMSLLVNERSQFSSMCTETAVMVPGTHISAILKPITVLGGFTNIWNVRRCSENRREDLVHKYLLLVHHPSDYYHSIISQESSLRPISVSTIQDFASHPKNLSRTSQDAIFHPPIFHRRHLHGRENTRPRTYSSSKFVFLPLPPYSFFPQPKTSLSPLLKPHC